MPSGSAPFGAFASIIERLDAGNENVRDYYVLPRRAVNTERLLLAERNAAELEQYRIDSLEHLSWLSLRQLDQ
jgi:hypothetical protein